MNEFPHLFSPLRVGNLEARNRIVSSTHSKLYGRNGTDSQRTIDYYVERAKGGTGILFSDAWIVHPSSALGLARRNWSERLARYQEVNRRLTAAVRDEGVMISARPGVRLRSSPRSARTSPRRWSRPTSMS
jgi:2,4-dienoyl-CoA reductase-like NADH-dependent reductase (Old Yellow Enzyme family)